MNGSIQNLLAANSLNANQRFNQQISSREKEAGNEQQAREAAKNFESLLVTTLLKTMRSTGIGDSLMSSDQTKLYRELFDKEIANSISANGGLGLADSIFHHLHQTKATVGADQEKNTSAQNLKPLPARLPLREPLISKPGHSGSRSGTDVHLDAISESVRIPAQTPQSFVNNLKPYALQAAHKLGTSAAAIISIAALETGWGTSIAKNPDGSSSHNLFGIKADSNWHGDQLIAKTREYYNGTETTEYGAFRSYNHESGSVADFVDFLQSNNRYKKALSSTGDDDKFLFELHRAGYATDPKYADKLISVKRSVEAYLL